jgi:hypothetical protein
MFLESHLLESLYDSHTHWLPTGEVLLGLNLRSLRSEEDLKTLKIENHHYRDEWLTGFGWDENDFSDLKLSKESLDKVFGTTPVLFSRVDGHTAWINSEGLKRLNLLEKFPGGILKEKDHIEALLSLPPFSKSQKINFLTEAMRAFNREGFTHIRDMGTTEDQFLCAKEIEAKGELTLHVIHNFVCENVNDFERAMAEALRCRDLESPLLKVAGLKFYFDGSLGSETALLSAPYSGTGNQYGVVNWEEKDLEEVFRKTWQRGFEVSIHTIGDEAAHRVIQMARRIYAEGISGHLNLEHVQLLRPETILSMKSLHVTCHMQPCHWLSDNKWLEQKLAGLYKYAFPWEALRAAKIPLFFGSDTPIEPISLFNNLKALEKSPKSKIKKFGDDPLKYHVSKKYKLPQTHTKFSGEKVEEVVFMNKKII